MREPVHEWIDTGGYDHPGWVYRPGEGGSPGKCVHWDDATIADHQHSADFLASFVTTYGVMLVGAPDLPYGGPTATAHDEQIAAHREAIIRLGEAGSRER